MSLLTAVRVVAVVTGSGLFLASTASQDQCRNLRGVVRDGRDEPGEQAADLVVGQWDQLAVACCEASFTASVARVTTGTAAAVMARVMWAYQAS